MESTDQVLGYLVDTSELGLVMSGLGGIKLYATVDASCGTHDYRNHTLDVLYILKSVLERSR